VAAEVAGLAYRGRVAAPGSGRRIELRFGWQVFNLVASGVPGMLPVATWIVPLAIPLLDDPGPHGNSPFLAGVLGSAAMVSMLVLPWLVPWLVLRARQPRGARLEWDEEQLVEWDGPSRRAVVAWRNAHAASVSWSDREGVGAASAWTQRAVQVVDTGSGAVITAWETEPDGAPVVRRRLCAKDLRPLITAMGERAVPLSGHANWSLAAEPGRRRSTLTLVLGRLGYPCAVLAPLLQVAPWAGVALGVVGAVLLAVRARPVWRELWTVRARVKSTHDAAWHEADRLRLRAIWFEAVVRAGFVVLTLASLGTLAWLRPR